MSAVVDSPYRSHISPHLDMMARPGSGWGSDPYHSRQTSYYPDQQRAPGQQPQGERLPGPGSLFSPLATSPPSAHAPTSQHQYPASPPGRDAHYNSTGRPPYYGPDYTTPPPVTQTPPGLPMPIGDQQPHHHTAVPRRPNDIRLSPTLSSAASDRSDEFVPPDGLRGLGGHAYHPTVPPARAHPIPQAAPTMPNVTHPMHQVGRAPTHEDGRHTSAATGGLMGKLVPQSYSANGRQPRSAAPPASPMNSQQPQQSLPPPPPPAHNIPTHHPFHVQPRHNAERQAHPSGYQAAHPDYDAMQRQKHSASPPLSMNGYMAHQEQPRQPHQSSMSPRQDPVRMNIHNLLNSGGGGGGGGGADDGVSSTSSVAEGKRRSSSARVEMTSAMTSPSSSSKAPMTPMIQQPLQSSEYKIRVRQQPVAARSCGFGERDRRVIDPPPIVQLFFDDPKANPDDVAARIRHPFSVVHCSIWNETGEQDNSAMPEDYRQQRRLMGTLVSSPFVGKDDQNEEGCFFCFPDLSCRTPGSFRLKFSLVVIAPTNMQVGSKAPILATAMSEVFTVYNAKDFPGMQASTALTKKLKEQGCLISIKKGNEKGSGPGGSGSLRDRDDSDYEDEDDATGGGGGGGGGPSGGPGGGSSSVGRKKRVRKT